MRAFREAYNRSMKFFFRSVFFVIFIFEKKIHFICLTFLNISVLYKKKCRLRKLKNYYCMILQTYFLFCLYICFMIINIFFLFIFIHLFFRKDKYWLFAGLKDVMSYVFGYATAHKVRSATAHKVRSATAHKIRSATAHKVRSATTHKVGSATAYKVRSATAVLIR